jgi:hypothetical protein
MAKKKLGEVVRKDLYVYNEATGFVVTSGRIGGKGWAPWCPRGDRTVKPELKALAREIEASFVRLMG